jgi:hypothetical protein
MKRVALSLLLFGILFSVVGLAQSATWTDPATNLMWAGQDNGSNVNWNQAKDYCANLRLAGYSNWRLGTIDELAGIYDETQDVGGWQHIKGGIKLSSVMSWSGSAGNAPGEAWGFNFLGGRRSTGHLGSSGFLRALCVRRP